MKSKWLCPGCKQILVRDLPRTKKKHSSYCYGVGRTVTLTRWNPKKK